MAPASISAPTTAFPSAPVPPVMITWRSRKSMEPAPLDSFVSLIGEVTALLIQAEALLADEGSEIGAGWDSVLACLVLRPAVEACLSPAFGIALAAIGPQRGAPAIVGLDLADHVALGVAVLDHGGRERQPWRDLARLLGPADAQPCDWNRARRQIERLGEDPGIIPDRTDRAGAEADGGGGLHECGHHDRTIDCRVEERIEVIVGERLVTAPRHHRQPCTIA